MADGASFKKFVQGPGLCDSTRPLYGFPTQEVNEHGFPTLQTLFWSKTSERINFSKCFPTCKKIADSLESKRRFKKKSFPTVLSNLFHCNNRRSRDADERNWCRPFVYFAVLVVMNAMENEQKSPEEDSHIC